MKELKKVLLIGLFSFLFIVNVNASTYTLDTSEMDSTYNSFFTDFPNFNRDNIYNMCDSLLSDYMNSSYEYYTCSFVLTQTSSGWYSYNSKNYTPQIIINQFKSDVTLGYKITTVNFTVVYDSANFGQSRVFSLNNDVTLNGYGSVNTRMNSNAVSTTSGLYPSNAIMFQIVKSNLTNQYFTHFYDQYSLHDLVIDDLYIGYNYREKNVNFTDLYLNSFAKVFPTELLFDLGTFNNSNVLTYKIKDEEPGKNKELKLKFTFLNQLDVTGDDIKIYKYGSQVYTEYSGTTCINEDTNSVCELNFEYDVYDSIDDKLMFDFKFDSYYNVKVEDNSGSNGIYSNHKDVEFEYKDLNFKEMSGAIFYLRNYDNFKYMSSYYDKDFFKFTFDNYTVSHKITYPNDIEYKNNYIYKDSNNFYKFDTGVYNKVNNISLLSIPFEYDLNLLDENKFPSFVIRNRNYLGSMDTDNLDLIVRYNSSLFNYNKLDYSTIVSNGSTSNYFGTNQDFNFTYNDNQNSFDVGVSSGEIFEFDEEIKVQYKSGLQYFKDKIINMFDFVSEFYNTMPNKFQVAFSLIFVLLIGIALFRLML